jgi:hypothetical protein
MAMLVPLSQPADEVQRYLAEGERLVSSFGPYHATSRRVILVIPAKAGIHLNKGREETRVHELPYITLESITEVKTTDRKKMMLGACLSGLGLATLFAWYLIVPIIAVVAGVFIILQGAIERPAYYQLKGRDMEGEDLYRWQIVHYGAGSFIASITMMTGIEITRD